MTNSCIYNGKVIHKRFKPKEHYFKYSVFSLLISIMIAYLFGNIDEISLIHFKLIFTFYCILTAFFSKMKHALKWGFKIFRAQ